MPPTERTASTTSAIWVARGDSMVRLGLAFAGIGGVKRGGEPSLLAIVAGAVPERRPADAGGAVPADDAAGRILAQHVVDEQVLRDDHVALHAEHFGDVGDAAGAVAQARRLD